MNVVNHHLQTKRFYPENWTQAFDMQSLFLDENPVEVDVGCGKGRFLLEHASLNPAVNFLGIDRMLRRIRKIDKKALRRELSNIRLLRMDAYYAVAHLIPPCSVSTYYVFFPDPWPKKRHFGNRLFDPQFLQALHRTLLPGGKLHFATDHLPYYDDVSLLLKGDRCFEEIEAYEPPPEEKSDFELQFIHKQIGRCSFIHRAR